MKALWELPLAEHLKRAENSMREKDKQDPEWVSAFLGNQKIYHRNAVKRAITEGEAVPQTVLSDYPEYASRRPGTTS